MDPLWIIAAFAFGSATSRIGMPPLVGYLLAGFVLNALGVSGGETLAEIANAGVTLLLFTIGLKLKIKSLARPPVWAGSLLHMVGTVAVFTPALLLLGVVGVPYFSELSAATALLVAFALSFSSTVFAVKVFESKRELPSRYATIAIGILIMQDIIAVVFLAASTGKLPTLWAPLLVAGLVLVRPLLQRVLQLCGHGELLMLFGILMTAGGYTGFELVGLKGDLGALVCGVLLAGSPKAGELADRLLGFKDLFLVGFFLNIGISGAPGLGGVLAALLLVVGVAGKSLLFFAILTRFKLRVRTALLTSLSLANYSEFGLIVGAIGVSAGWLSGEWLVIIAVALSFSFFIAAPANSSAHQLYARFGDRLARYESRERLPEDLPISVGEARVAIIGMGTIGTAAYEAVSQHLGQAVVGVDFSQDAVRRHQAAERWVLFGDADDYDFWRRYNPGENRLELIMLALPTVEASLFAIRQLRERGYPGQFVVSVRHDDQIPLVQEAGVTAVYSLHQEAGAGFAGHALAMIDSAAPVEDGGSI